MKKTVVLLSALAASLSASATDGYFSHGYGMTAKGMGGAATATAFDSFGGANNPASMVWVGNRLDVGVDLFSPKRSAERTGSMTPGIAVNGRADSDSNLFLIPEFGYNRMLSAERSLGITVYGNGGMNTNYSGGQIGAASMCAGFDPRGPGASAPYNLLCGSGSLGQNLIQLIIAPTYAMKLNKDNSVGVSLLLGYQRFKAEGLDSFYGFTPNALTAPGGIASNNYVTNRGVDSSWGYGVKLGWMGKVSDAVTLGATYTSKMKMQEFEKYKELFAGRGYFDMPDSFTLGIAAKAAPNVLLVADYQRINYSGIKSVANASNINSAFAGLAPNSLFPGFPGAPPGTVGSLGCDNCRGFGWDSVNVVKLGVEYQYSPDLKLRAGYNHTDNPIQARDVTFNIIAPGVVRDHITLGFTHALSKDSELTMAYMHAFSNSVQGPSLFNTWSQGAPAGTEKIQMYENSLGIAYGLKLK